MAIGTGVLLAILFVVLSGTLSGCDDNKEPDEVVNIEPSKASGSPPDPVDKKKEPIKLDPVGYLDFSKVPSETEPVVEGARLFCTGCPSESVDRRIRLPESDPMPREKLDSFDASSDTGFPAYRTYNPPPIPEFMPVSKFDNTTHRIAQNDKFLMNHLDNRPDINIPRFSNCITSGGQSSIAQNYSSGEGWQTGDGNCPMEIPIDAYWQESKGDVVVTSGKTLIFPRSFIICQKGGVIGFLDSGQVEGEEIVELERLLIDIEKPYLDKHFVIDKDGKTKIGIKPQNVGDGYVTLANGHIIQTEEDAIKYGFDGVPTDGTLTDKEINEWISKQQEKYGNGFENPANFSFERAAKLLHDDLNARKNGKESYIDTAQRHAKNSGNSFTDNEMDAITSLVYNGNKANSPDNLLYHLLKKDKEGALAVINKAVKEGWYNENPGHFRRRLMEVNIFFNNDYTFYDKDDLDDLIRKSGYEYEETIS